MDSLSWTGIIPALFFPWLAGSSFILFLLGRRSVDPLTFLSLGYLAGFGILGQWMLILSIFKIPLYLIFISVPLLSISVVFLFLHFRKPPPLSDSGSTQSRPFNLLGMCLLIYIFYFIMYVFWRSLHYPFYVWDEFETIVFKSKVLFYDQSLVQLPYTPHPTYPLQVEFALTWVALNLGGWNDVLLKIIFPFTLASFLKVSYFFLRQFVSRNASLLGLAIILSSNLLILHSTIAYRDMTIMVYFCTTIILILLWKRNNNEVYLILASIFAGFGSFIKLEGTGYLGVHCLMVGLILLSRKNESLTARAMQFIKFLTPALLMCASFYIFKKLNLPDLQEGVRCDFDYRSLYFGLSREQLARIPIVVEIILNNLFCSGNWNIVWFLFCLSLISFKKVFDSFETKIIFFYLVCIFGIYTAGYALTQHYIWVIGSNAVLSRGLLHSFPLAVFFLILLHFQSKISVRD